MSEDLIGWPMASSGERQAPPADGALLSPMAQLHVCSLQRKRLIGVGARAQDPSRTSTRGLELEDRERRTAMQNRRLKEELSSLKDVYARQMARNEEKFERCLREKDQECRDWYKSKKIEIQKMQATTVLMWHMFKKKREKFQLQLDEKARELEERRLFFENELVRIDEERKAEVQRLERELRETSREYERQIKVLQEENSQKDVQIGQLNSRLSERDAEIARLKREREQILQELAETHKRLLEVEQSEELMKRSAQIEALEAELRRTKRMMEEKARNEADALRKELMEYVKFIVHILPEDWRNKKIAPPGMENLPMENLPADIQKLVASSAVAQDYLERGQDGAVSSMTSTQIYGTSGDDGLPLIKPIPFAGATASSGTPRQMAAQKRRVVGQPVRIGPQDAAQSSTPYVLPGASGTPRRRAQPHDGGGF